MSAEETPRIQTLDGVGARLGVASSVLGLAPVLPPLGKVLEGRVLGYDLSSASRTSTTVGDHGAIVLEAEGLDSSQEKRPHPNQTEASLTLETGSLHSRWSRAERSVYAKRHDVTFILDRWEWQTGARAAAWIGHLRGASVWRGNASLSTTIDGEEMNRGGAECFEGGGLRWLIVPKARADAGARGLYDAIVEPLEGEVTADRLRHALPAVSFVLGRRLALDYMVGVDQTLVPVAAVAVQPESPTGGTDSPLPFAVQRDQRWHAEFFRLLADWISEDDERSADITHVVTSAYHDAADEHIEGAYLKLQVALEAFCFRSGKAGLPSLENRADPKAWKGWVEEHADRIRELARTEEDAKTLLSVVKGAYHASSSRRVERFFELHGIALPAEATAAIRGRDRIVHQYTLGPRSRNSERELARIGISQALIVAALALFIGYHGPIANGRDMNSSPDWWPWKPGVAPPPSLIRCVADVATLASLKADAR
ncbi:MAG: hypothetical protein GXP55_21385 [Deltaproteobacteria bacterium]|nr:hypothetical protein [Deltaproteobacteria bacterium]